jgi:hypothetical protein
MPLLNCFKIISLCLFKTLNLGKQLIILHFKIFVFDEYRVDSFLHVYYIAMCLTIVSECWYIIIYDFGNLTFLLLVVEHAGLIIAQGHHLLIHFPPVF